MKNLTNVFLDTAPSRFKLAFGVNKNVILKSVDNNIRRDKNGVKINKNCYMTFAAIDVENNNKITAESTFSFFNIDKPAYATKGFIHQFNQIIEIAKAVVPADHMKKVTVALNSALIKDAELFKEITATSSPSAKLTKSIGELQIKVVEAFIKAVSPFTGDNGDKVNLVVITDAKGIFFDLPREDKGFIAKAEGGRALSVDAKYIRWYENKDKVEKAEKEDLGDDTVIDEDDILVDDEQDLDL